MPQYLQKRRRKWYAVMAVPKALHTYFGKAKFIRSLETDSLSVAERKVLTVVADWKKQIETARGNELGTDDEIMRSIKLVRQDALKLRSKGVNESDIKEVHESIAIDQASGERNDGVGGDDGALITAVNVVYGADIYLIEHVEEYQNSRDVEQKTRDMQTRDIKLFSEHFIYTSSVTRDKVVHWVNVILGAERGLAPATRSRIISACRGYWEYLIFNKGLKIEPPFNRVLPPKPKNMTKAQVQKLRTSFKVKDYHKILNATEDQPLIDLIKIVAHTGCRIEEICSLKLEDISHDRFEVIDAKTRSGWRTVPIHSEIKQLITRLIDTTEDEYLFGGLTFNKYNRRSNAIGKRFGRLKTKLGYGKVHVFHSFRYGFSSQLENAMIQQTQASRLTGHKVHGMTYGLYSDGLAFERLREVIEHIDWKLPTT
jgi:integrase